MPVQPVDMSGKICIVTGANSGIGKETARGLAIMGATVIMACRDEARGNEARDDIARGKPKGALCVMPLDLASQRTIRAFAEAFKAAYSRLDVLINNAAIVPMKREVSAEGIEKQFAVNHLGPFLLTHLLLDLLKASAPARVVTVSSMLHARGEIDFDDLEFKTRKYTWSAAYNQSKLANVMFTCALARRLEGTGVTANCLHPGVVRTNIARDAPFPLNLAVKVYGMIGMIGPEDGAQTSLYCATAPELAGVTGKYFDECKERPAATRSQDREAQEKLWAVSEKMTGLA